MKSVYALVIRTWGSLFIASEKTNTKNTCEPTHFPYFTIVSLPAGNEKTIFTSLSPFQLFVKKKLKSTGQVQLKSRKRNAFLFEREKSLNVFTVEGEKGGFPRNPDYSKDSGNPDILTKYLGSTLPNCNVVARLCLY